MKKCPNCGRAYSDMVSVCPECKVSLNGSANGSQTYQNPPQPTQPPQPSQQYNQAPVPSAAKKDSGSIFWGIPGLLLPLVGVILYFCWKKSRPKTASVALKGAAIGFLLNMAMQFIPI